MYPAGTWGPNEAADLLEREDRKWDPLSDTSGHEIAIEADH